MAYLYNCLSYCWTDVRLDLYVRYTYIFSFVWVYTTRTRDSVVHVGFVRYISRRYIQTVLQEVGGPLRYHTTNK